jgi:hypothetical protein
MKSQQSRALASTYPSFSLKAFGVLVIAMGLWTASSMPKAQGIDRAAGSAAGIAANVALQASPTAKPERFANRLLTEDPAVLAQAATRAINNIRSKLDSCGDDGMLALPEERAKSSARAIKVSSADIAARPILVFNPRLADAALKHFLITPTLAVKPWGDVAKKAAIAIVWWAKISPLATIR